MIQNLVEKINLQVKVPVVHEYVYRKLVNRDSKLLKKIPDGQTIIERKYLKVVLSRLMIPLEIQPEFLKEMESYNLIKINKNTIEIVRR